MPKAISMSLQPSSTLCADPQWLYVELMLNAVNACKITILRDCFAIARRYNSYSE